MPEGHTVHRLARTFTELFAGQVLAVSSPQGRFAAGAVLLDGTRLVASRAWGKQLFLGFA
ncbi:DNA glycosylase, partial [Actinotalea fermentans ATCC 43279 = JCM 9966 = DSM 3133]